LSITRTSTPRLLRGKHGLQHRRVGEQEHADLQPRFGAVDRIDDRLRGVVGQDYQGMGHGERGSVGAIGEAALSLSGLSGRSRRGVELDVVELGVDAVQLQELVVRALLVHDAVLEDDDLVRIAIVERRCAMVMTVRPFISRSRPLDDEPLDSVSSAAVGSSRIRIGVSRMIARAMPMR
jgi:hypothetical protein